MQSGTARGHEGHDIKENTMQPKSRKKLQLGRETLRSLMQHELGKIAGGISHETMCNSKDIA